MHPNQHFRTTADERHASYAPGHGWICCDVIPHDRRYLETPPLKVAEELAALTRQHFSVHAGALAVAEAIVENKKWGLRYSPLNGTLQAVLSPLLRGGFSIVVDPNVPRGDDTDAILAQRIGHEIGHTFFYTKPVANEAPRRISNSFDRFEEELFCDEFAARLFEK